MKHLAAPALMVLALATVTPISAAEAVHSSAGEPAMQLAQRFEPLDAADAVRAMPPPTEQPAGPPPPQRPAPPMREQSHAAPPQPAGAPAPEPIDAERPRTVETPLPARRPDVMRAEGECRDCAAPRPRYDSVEVVRTRRTVDRSRVINTRSVVPVYRYAPAVVEVPAVTVVEFIVHHYHVVERPLTYRMPAERSFDRVYRRPYPRRVLRVGG